jgi:hypothetical protein
MRTMLPMLLMLEGIFSPDSCVGPSAPTQPPVQHANIAGSYAGPVLAAEFVPGDTLRGTVSLTLTEYQQLGTLGGTFAIEGTLAGGGAPVPVAITGSVDGSVGTASEGDWRLYLRDSPTSTCSHAIWGTFSSAPPHLFIVGGFIYTPSQGPDCPAALHGQNVSPSELFPQ